MTVSDLELDLDVFQGPFDLLLALIMREEVDLAEVPIADIVVAFVERMAERGEIDLDAASEFPGADRRPARDQGAPAVRE